MTRPYDANAARYRPHSLHTRIPPRERIRTGQISYQPSEPASSPSSSGPGLGGQLLNWFMGAKPTPGYKAAAAAGSVDEETLQRIEDLRTVLQNHSPRPTQLQLMAKDHLEIPPDMSNREKERRMKQLIRNGKTEFFLNLENAEKLPSALKHKYCNPDSDDETASIKSYVLNDGIGFMVPNTLLPEDFKPNSKEAVKAWLGLDSKVDFKLYSNRKNLNA